MDENGTQTWTLYDGSDPIMDFNSSGSLEMRYLNGPTGQLVDTVLARESSGGTIAWYLPDRLGTVRDLISNSGSIIDHVDYSAFGTVLDESSPTSGDRMTGFAGMERDTATGLNLAVNRLQNPGTGRWDTEDPLGFRGNDSDLYRYVENDPVGFADSLGLIFAQRKGDKVYGGPATEAGLLQKLANRLGVPVSSLNGIQSSPLWQYLAKSKNAIIVKFYDYATFEGPDEGGHTRKNEDGTITVVVNIGNASCPEELLRWLLHELIHAALFAGGKLKDADGDDVGHNPGSSGPDHLSPGANKLINQLTGTTGNLPPMLPKVPEDR